MEKFKTMSKQDIININGGLLAGGLAGAILGGTVGLVGATGYAIANGDISGNAIYKTYVTTALSGAAIGACLPI